MDMAIVAEQPRPFAIDQNFWRLGAQRLFSGVGGGWSIDVDHSGALRLGWLGAEVVAPGWCGQQTQ